MPEYLIGVDLGGTRIRAALMDTNLNIIQRVETLTQSHEGVEPTLERIKEQVRRVMPADGSPIRGIGLSVPGPTNPERGVIINPPNLTGWQEVYLGDILHEAFDVPIYVGNDANVAALAEVARGAARGYRHVIYITVSTGIGSGIVIDGRLILGTTGLAAEAGHMMLHFGEGRVSSLENEAAGPDMADQARQRIAAGESSSMAEAVAGDLDAINGSTVGQAAQQGDKLALDIVSRSAMLIGLGMVNLLHLFNPQILVIGGGVSNLGDLLFGPIHETIQKYCIADDYWKDLVITTPDLGEDVSLYGAGTLVLTQGGVVDVGEVVATIGD